MNIDCKGFVIYIVL